MDVEYQVDIDYETNHGIKVKNALLMVLDKQYADIIKNTDVKYHIVAYSDLSMEGVILPTMRSLYKSGLINNYSWREKICTDTASDSDDYHNGDEYDNDVFNWFVKRYGYKKLETPSIQFTKDGNLVVMTHTKDTPFEIVNIGWSEADEDVWMEICDKDPAVGATYAFAYIEDNPDCADLNNDKEAEY